MADRWIRAAFDAVKPSKCDTIQLGRFRGLDREFGALQFDQEKIFESRAEISARDIPSQLWVIGQSLWAEL